jgi:hypothetical protein
MTRSGYSEGCEGWELIRWRGAVESAIGGARGQKFLRDLVAALDALPEKRLIQDELQTEDGVCAIGSVGLLRSVDMTKLDVEDYDQLADAFDIAPALVREIEFINDEVGWRETPEARFTSVRSWALENLAGAAA